MRSRISLCAIAAVAVATTTLTLPTLVQAGAYPGNKCVAAKLKAASGDCQAVLGAWSKYVGGGGTDTGPRDAALTKAAGKMTSAWSKAEESALKKEVDCADMTLTDSAAQTAITGAVTGIVNDVLLNLTLSNPADAKCGAALVKAAAGQCAALLKSESGYIAKLAAGKTKRDAANDKADGKLTSSVNKALAGGCPSGADATSLHDAVDELTDDLITRTTISPNVDNTQFTTISPAQNPGQAYEGTQLHPICAFNTPYHYFVKRGSVNKLVMYYQGGGACWSTNTCVTLTTFDTNVDPLGSDNPNNTTTGFGDLTNPLNPFKDWNIVFVAYCSGDIHFGDSNPSYSGHNTQHKGWHNARTAEKFAREHFVNPEEVFVTGSSAGAYGAFFNAPLHEAVWPDSKFTVLADAGNGIITPDFLNTPGYGFDKWNFVSHLPTYIPGVLDAITSGVGIPAFTEAVAKYFPNTAWGHYSSSYDGGTGGQTGFYNVMLNSNPDNVLNWASWWNASCAWNTKMRMQAITTAAAIHLTTDNYRYYIGTGSRHTMYGSDKVYTDTTGGVPLIVDWVNAMLARGPGWTNVECAAGTCGTLLPGDPKPSPLAPPFGTSGPDTVITCP